MKHLLLLALTVFLFAHTSQAQTNTKNTIYLGYSFIEADRFTGGNLSAKGFEIGYSRYINDRFYGDITYGKFNFEGKGNVFFWNLMKWITLICLPFPWAWAMISISLRALSYQVNWPICDIQPTNF